MTRRVSSCKDYYQRYLQENFLPSGWHQNYLLLSYKQHYQTSLGILIWEIATFGSPPYPNYSERGKSYPFFKTRKSIGLPTVQSIEILILQLRPILCFLQYLIILLWEIATFGSPPYPNYSELGKSYPFFKTRASIGLSTVQSIEILILQLWPILSFLQYLIILKNKYHIMRQCWHFNCRNRSSFSELLFKLET